MASRRIATATSSKPAAPPEPEINVTPLDDVVLVLLIIFMVIAPNLQEGTPVVLPEVKTTDEKAKTEGIDVVIDGAGALYLDDQLVTREALLDALRELHGSKPDKPLVVKADAKLPYGRVREVFADVQRLGFRNVSMKVAARKDPEET
jgi:biopolymer transport protein ExbD/biopolymer transport protein TolR